MHAEYNPEFATDASALASALFFMALMAALIALTSLATAITRTYRTLPTGPIPARALRATLMVLIGAPIRLHRTRMTAVRRDTLLRTAAVYRIAPTGSILHLLDEQAS